MSAAELTAKVDRLAGKLDELRGQRVALEVVMTKEDLVRNVDEWLTIAHAQSAGASRLVLGGQASGDHLAQVLHEDRLADSGLAGRIVARLEEQGFGSLSDRAKKGQSAKFDSAIATAEKDLLAARKVAALDQVEHEFEARKRDLLALAESQSAGEVA